MKDEQWVFIDTNILIYRSFGSPTQKQKIQELFEKHDHNIFISVQVLNEFINASLKKKLFENNEQLEEALKFFISAFRFCPMDVKTVLKAVEIRRRYQFSHYDSVIVATALKSNCKILYSEDLHNGLLISNKLKIVNPFI